MTIKIDSNKNDSSYGEGGKKSSDTQDIIENQVDSHADVVGNLESDLPGNGDNFGKVNWLGSSYSGVDIKVVVHLYEDVAMTAEEARFNEDIALNRRLVDAYMGLYSAVQAGQFLTELPSSSQSRYDIVKAFVGDDIRVVSEILSFVRSFDRYPLPGRISMMLSAIDENISNYQSLVNADNETAKTFDELRKKSSSTLVLANLQTISVQSHREKNPVRSLGTSQPKGFVRGPRTIAGSMIFTLFNEHSLAQLIRAMGSGKNRYGETSFGDEDLSSLLSDQLPPIDITIVFANEYGSLSQASIYGLEFINNGMTLSIEDLLTEEVTNFVARDLDPVVYKGNIGLSRKQRGMHFNAAGKRDETGTDLLFTSKDAYNAHLEKLKVRWKFRSR